MRQNRPVNLDLAKFSFPVTAIVSILHRLSGLFLFFVIPFMLWGIQYSLAGPSHYQAFVACITSPVMLFVIWVVLSALIYHIVAGVRHLLMDVGMGETLKGGRHSSYWVFGISIVLSILTAIGLVV